MSKTHTQAIITTAIARLEALHDSIQSGACFDVLVQAESFIQFESYAARFDEIVTDARIGLYGEAMGWGDQICGMSPRDRKSLRERVNDDRGDVLDSSRTWATGILEGRAA